MNNKNRNRNHFELYFQNISSNIDILIDKLDEEKFNFSTNYLNENQKKLIETVNFKLFELKNIIDSKENRNLYFKNQKLINEYFKNKEFINKCLKNKILIDKYFTNKINNSLTNNNLSINNFEKVNVKPDGTCLYHSIMKSMDIMNIDIIEKIKNLNLKNIYINNTTKLDGFFLRKVLVEYLNSIPKKYLTENIINLTKLNYNSKIERININNAIKSTNLIEDPKYYNESGNQKTIPLKNKINKLKEKIKDNSEWGSEDDLILISFIFCICIFCYNSKYHKWLSFKKKTIKKCSFNNSIFIIYNGENHYDSLRLIKNL